MCQNVIKNLIGKCSLKFLDHVKKSATDALETFLKRVIEWTREATGDLIVNKVANIVTKVSKNSQNNSGTFSNEHDKEISNRVFEIPVRGGVGEGKFSPDWGGYWEFYQGWGGGGGNFFSGYLRKTDFDNSNLFQN